MGGLQVEVDPAEVGMDQARLERIGRHFAGYADSGRLPGWLITVSRHGRLAYVATRGHRDVEAGLPVEPDTLWRIYSMTKPVTSVAAMMLYEEGAFQLTDPVTRPAGVHPGCVHGSPLVYTTGMESGQASMREARARFAELLDAAERGNVTVITRHGRATAAIVPAALLDQLGKPDAQPLSPDDGTAARAAAASLRDALRALEPLLGPDTAPAEAAAHAVPYQARPGRPALVAASLASLRGPARGVVELPLRLFWSAPEHTFDLAKPSMVQAMYEAVLREASRPDDLTTYLNGDLLVAVWPDLYLPKGLRRAWEDRHPALRAARLASV